VVIRKQGAATKMRKNDLSLRSVLLAGACCVAIVGVTFMRLSEAQGRQAQMAAAMQPSASIPAVSVPPEIRRALAGTCEGFNVELEHAAGTALRAGNRDEANRLMAMRQPCSGTVVATSAK
jgi:hypothetical protein